MNWRSRGGCKRRSNPESYGKARRRGNLLVISAGWKRVRLPIGERYVVKKLLCLPCLILLSCLALAQSSSPPPGYAVTPGFGEADRQTQQMDRETAPHMPQAERPSFAEMQRNAKELASLARTIPPDIDLTAKGLLAKDLASRLKKIEKLAKQLRSEISR